MSKKADTAYQIRLPEELLNRASETAEKTGLSKNDVIKQGIRLGLPLVLKALNLTPEQLAGIPEQPEPLPAAA
jgi:hypothetical protein